MNRSTFKEMLLLQLHISCVG